MPVSLIAYLISLEEGDTMDFGFMADNPSDCLQSRTYGSGGGACSSDTDACKATPDSDDACKATTTSCKATASYEAVEETSKLEVSDFK